MVGRQRNDILNGVSLAGRRWPNIKCWLCNFVIVKEIRTSIAKEPYIIVIFQGRPDPLPPPLWIRTCSYVSYRGAIINRYTCLLHIANTVHATE